MKLKEIKKSLCQEKLFPLKRWGQNFLIREEILEKIIKIAEVKPTETILEIGSGPGNLTQELAKRAKRVIAVENDWRMVKISEKILKNFKNVKIIQGDILSLPISNLYLPKNYKVVANLPFYITSPVIRKFLEADNQPKEMVLMVQKEVAERICAKVPRMNLLAISVQFYAKPRIECFVPKESFWPQPKVDSAIIKILPRKSRLKDNLKKNFFKIVKAGFSHPRKQLINNLALSLKIDKIKIREWLLKNKIQPSQRGENLDLKDWLNLAKTFIF